MISLRPWSESSDRGKGLVFERIVTVAAGFNVRAAAPRPANRPQVVPGVDSRTSWPVQFADFMPAYNFARRLKTFGGLTPYEYIARIWTSEPERFILNPIHQMPELNT